MTLEEEDFEVLDFSIGEQDDIFAEVRARIARFHIDSERGLRNRIVLELDQSEAFAEVVPEGLCSSDLTCEDGQEHAEVTGIG